PGAREDRTDCPRPLARERPARLGGQPHRRRPPPRARGRLGLDRRQLDDLDAGREARSLTRVETSCPELDDRGGGAADGRPQRVADRAAVEALGQVPGDENVSGADRRDGLDPRDRRAEALYLPLLAEERKARRLLRDEDVSRPEVGD